MYNNELFNTWTVKYQCINSCMRDKHRHRVLLFPGFVFVFVQATMFLSCDHKGALDFQGFGNGNGSFRP